MILFNLLSNAVNSSIMTRSEILHIDSSELGSNFFCHFFNYICSYFLSFNILFAGDWTSTYVKLYNLFFFSICVLWGYSNLITLIMSLDGWIKLTWMVFCVLLNFFFQFHLLTLSWLKIELHNLFWFAFYGVILSGGGRGGWQGPGPLQGNAPPL